MLLAQERVVSQWPLLILVFEGFMKLCASPSVYMRFKIHPVLVLQSVRFYAKVCSFHLNVLYPPKMAFIQ